MPSLAAAPRWQRRFAASADGSTVAFYQAGAGAGAPALVISSEPGADPDVWRAQLQYLGDRLQFVTWDHRGCRASGIGHPGTGRFGVTAQLEDLSAVLDTAAVARFALLGYGAGVRIAVEAAHHLAERIAALVLVSGAPGLPPTPAPGGWHFGRPTRAARSQPHRAAGPDACRQTLHALAAQDGWAMLGGLAQPTLVLTGGRDDRLPAAVAHQLARRIPDSQVLMVPPAGHQLFAEYPDLVNLALERFFEDVGWC